MKVPLSWLREFVDVDLPPEELAHRLTMSGTEVGSIDVIGGTWDNVFVAQVASIDPHPNADRLKLATVSLHGEQTTVVCGAPNIAAGQLVAFARVGARLVDPRTGDIETLRAATIRGVWSRPAWSAQSASWPSATTTRAYSCCRTTPPSAHRSATTSATWSLIWR